MNCTQEKIFNHAKKCTAAEAARAIKNGDRVFVGFASGTAYGMMDALWERRGELSDITILSSNGQKECRLFAGEGEHPFRVSTPFMGFGERIAEKNGREVAFTSFPLSEVDRWIKNTGKPDVAILMVSAPDAKGYMSYGPSGCCVNTYAKEAAKTVILQINKKMPFIAGKDCLIHASEADYIVELSGELGELYEEEPTDEISAISKHILAEIPDGATIQLGIGKLSTAIGYGLRNKNDLGIHSELFSEPMMHLMKNGNVTNTRKGYMDGKSVFSFAIGTNELYQYMDHNELLFGAPFPYVNDPRIIAQNKRMISINSAMSVDLFGQVSAESIGWRQFSAVGGQTDFAIGAQMSEGGKSIIATTSSFIKNGKRRSKIVLQFEPGTVVTTPRALVQYIATEYGCVNLKALPMRERAKAMISLAHPDFRDELREQAKELNLI